MKKLNENFRRQRKPKAKIKGSEKTEYRKISKKILKSSAIEGAKWLKTGENFIKTNLVHENLCVHHGFVVVELTILTAKAWSG